MSSADAYMKLVATPSDINEHLPTFVELCQHLDAKKVIELGVRSGVSTVGWLVGLELTGGHLWSVDIGHRPHLAADHWTYIQGDDRDEGVIAQLPDKADAVFVDTSHEYAHTCEEIGIYSRRVRPGGCMVFHDVAIEKFTHHLTEQPAWPVRQAVREWVRRDGLRADWYSNNNGLAVVWVGD